MIRQDEITAVGKFQKTHALKGELNAILKIDPEYLNDGNAVVIDTDGIFIPYFVSSVRPKGTTSYILKIDGIDMESEAKNFVNKTIYAINSKLGPFLYIGEEDVIEEEEFIGYSIIDTSSDSMVGIITTVDSTTDNILFIVETDESETIYIPAVNEFIIDVDDENKIIKMTLPEGLVNLNIKSEKR